MLPEERYAAILNRIKQNRVVTVHELVQTLDSSAPTIRRDLTYLHKKGLLQKVHGGATIVDMDYEVDREIYTEDMSYQQDRESIAYAAYELIDNAGFIYIDSGSTTELILPHLQKTNATFVTNGIAHATFLASRHLKVILLGGNVKTTSISVVGNIALDQLEAYNFTQGFFNAAGISVQSGFTAQDPLEAAIKQKALSKCTRPYILADPTKFDTVSAITFAPLEKATIITSRLPNEVYRNHAVIKEVDLL